MFCGQIIVLILHSDHMTSVMIIDPHNLWKAKLISQ